MRRRGVGIGAVRKKQEQAKQFNEVGDQLAESQMAHVTTQLESFKVNLEQFAVKYKNNIKKDPEFRKMFQTMCARIGVDPLASKKGFWSELLDVGDFYYELAVQIIEVCIITRYRGPVDTGLSIETEEWRADRDERFAETAGEETKRHDAGAAINAAAKKITDDDVKRAVKKLSVLGEGFQLIEMEERTMVVTVPIVLSSDHATILSLAQNTGGMVTTGILARELGWDKKRSMLALNVLLREGMTWVDEQHPLGSHFVMAKAKFTCEYCQKSFDDSQDARRRHFQGRNHKTNVKLWYDSFADQAQHAAAANAPQPPSEPAPMTWQPLPAATRTPRSNAPPPTVFDVASLPPSMIPAPPEAFLFRRIDWG
ncbi:Vacuolar sorting protein snf8, partial [Globisporangium splendens]